MQLCDNIKDYIQKEMGCNLRKETIENAIKNARGVERNGKSRYVLKIRIQHRQWHIIIDISGIKTTIWMTPCDKTKLNDLIQLEHTPRILIFKFHGSPIPCVKITKDIRKRIMKYSNIELSDRKQLIHPGDLWPCIRVSGGNVNSMVEYLIKGDWKNNKAEILKRIEELNFVKPYKIELA